MPDRISVFLRDLIVDLRVGVHEHEKKAPQPIKINLTLGMKDAPSFRDEQEAGLERVIEYVAAHRFITTQLTRHAHIPLLETLAEKIVDFCWTDPRIHDVTVRLEKPGVLPHSAGSGIEMTRTRQS